MNLPPQGQPLSPAARGVRLGSTPTVSVVVASCRERPLLDACLASLLPQCRRHATELIVARAADEVRPLEGEYPEVSFTPAPAGATIPHLRAAGMAAATGDIVMLTEDHCVVAEDWLDRMLASYREDTDVAGGSMDNGQRERATDWAAYFSEYGFFLESTGTSQEPSITGANVAYSRRVIGDVVALAAAGEWENIIHERLARAGHAFQFLRTAAVYQNQNHRFRKFCRDRFVHGRDFARRRLAEEGENRRWLYLPGTAILPGILLVRVGRIAMRRHRLAFLRALPLTMTFFAAWSVGEAVGYWRGPSKPGDRDG
ncbi:hypothetical protein BH23GEM3_BH23GEM3_09990 [soil metagenome]